MLGLVQELRPLTASVVTVSLVPELPIEPMGSSIRVLSLDPVGADSKEAASVNTSASWSLPPTPLSVA